MHSLAKGDVVFLYHKGQGIVAAGRVRNDEVKEDTSCDALYRDLEWLTAKPGKGAPYSSMPAPQIKQVTGRNFWWAKTMKAPFLNKEETERLLAAAQGVLGGATRG